MCHDTPCLLSSDLEIPAHIAHLVTWPYLEIPAHVAHLVTSDILVPKIFLVLILIPFQRIYFTSSFTSSSEIIIVLVLVLIPHLQ